MQSQLLHSLLSFTTESVLECSLLRADARICISCCTTWSIHTNGATSLSQSTRGTPDPCHYSCGCADSCSCKSVHVYMRPCLCQNSHMTCYCTFGIGALRLITCCACGQPVDKVCVPYTHCKPDAAAAHTNVPSCGIAGYLTHAQTCH